MFKMRRVAASSGLLLGLLAVFPLAGQGAETEVLYLSGKGKDDPVKWDFMCSAGQNSGTWSTIGVPSNWELQGFGNYTYGSQRLNPWPKVTGHYKRTFTVPAGWGPEKEVFIVFEGVMTDTQVMVNGQSAGALHAGGYYRFKYDITKLLKAGENTLEVTVDDESATPSVNNAERRGDYWNYGGIFRPVYLEAVPVDHIERVAIDAKADGTLNVDVHLPAMVANGWLKLQARDAAGNAFGAQITHTLDSVDSHISVKIANPKLWTAETPNLYTLDVALGTGTQEIHSLKQKFGFRTLEVRAGEGLFLNGSRIMFKGADRHSFWPDSGRCLSEKVSRDDIAVMKEMNMNAVRMSHYPPDQHFLDACDELGIYVLDELAGWHQAYDTATGVRLVEEMVTRDVNHPCIMFWDNGNEGGWNNALDTEFAKWDPRGRQVLHPQQTLRGIDNSHYPQYNAVVTKSNGNLPFFPTEMLHGLYDGGHGAGLEDYWRVMMASKVASGGFLWSLNDETLVRTDKGGKLDSMGNQAPDGILGPYREKEGSFYTVKELWSPMVLTPESKGAIDNGSQSRRVNFKLENRFDFIDAKECRIFWELRRMKSPTEDGAGSQGIAAGQVTLTDSIPPHGSGVVALDMPLTFASADTLAVLVQGPDRREVARSVFPLSKNFNDYRALATANREGAGNVMGGDIEGTSSATAGDLTLHFNKQTGLVSSAVRGGKTFSFINGPRLLAANPTPAAPARGGTAPAPLPPLPDPVLSSLTQKADGNDVVVAATFGTAAAGETPALQGMKSITYRLRPNGWLTIDYAYSLTGPHEYFGVGFDYPEANVQSMRYLGNGPSTVYQNRLAGGTLDVWEKKYNNTMVGDPDDLKPGEHFDYPIFKGYYAGVRWLQLMTSEGPITALVNQDDLFVQVLTPKVPPAGQIGQTGVPFPNAGISFLHAIPAIGSKFNGPKSTGPQGQPAEGKGDYRGSISLYFGDIH